MKRAAIASIAAGLGLVCAEAEVASAADGLVCPPPGSAWLRVTFAGDGFTAALRAGVVEQLAAELRRHGLILCEGVGVGEAEHSSEAGPLAEIGLTLTPDSVLSLEVRDAVTDKRITRALPLGSVPRDALALSITLAAEELLHASWIEAALAPASTPTGAAVVAPAKAVPAAVRAVNAEEIARMPQVASPEPGSRTTTAAVAVLGAVDRSTGAQAASGQTDLGGDVRFSYGGRLAISARVGVREAQDVTSAHGTVRGSELLAGLGAAYAIVPRDAAWGGEIGARVDALDVTFSGTPSAGAQPLSGLSGSRLGVLVGGALGGWGRLGGPWRVVAEAVVGAPVRAVTAIDDGATATGVAGVSIGGALGVAATLF
jgi:hypothetical protein